VNSKRKERVSEDPTWRIKESLIGMCVDCKERPIDVSRSTRRCTQCLDKERSKSVISGKKYREKERKMVINAYGGKCRDCGVDDVRVLDLHHSNGDGSKHREQFDNGLGFQRFLKSQGYPQDLGLIVLCANCHRIAHSSS
jgi:hypothetical protein